MAHDRTARLVPAARGSQLRVSDAERERVAAALTRGAARGYLSMDTLDQRLEVVFGLRSRAELDALLDDLPGGGGWRLRLTRALRRRRRGRARPSLLPLSVAPRGWRILLGRSQDCDYVFDDPSVSRHHAEIRFVGPSWVLRDLGSTNGVTINGARVRRAALRAGDEVVIGTTRLLCR